MSLKKYNNFTFAELKTKHFEFTKELLNNRLSMDNASITVASNIQNLIRELKVLQRLISKNNKNQGTQKENF